MSEQVSFHSADVTPAPDAVFTRMGLPGSAVTTARYRGIVDEALAEFAHAARPRALTCEVGRAEFEAIYRGDGRNAARTPLDEVYPQAARLVLFAATLGESISDRIAELCAAGDTVGSFALDAVASAAADRLADGLCARVSAAMDDTAGRAVLAYSPGHCGWDISGQRALFARLRPDTIGIRLNDACLMTPIKSVSGVLAAGRPGIHRFSPDFGFCAPCATRACASRMASVA